MTILLPRLPGPAAERLLDMMLSVEGLRWNGYAPDPQPDGVRFAATGGSTVSDKTLRALRSTLVEAAEPFGFGSDGKDDHPGFDAALADWMSHHDELRSGEALRDDVWSYFGVVMAPDIVHWRFGESRERYLGGVRNTFQRVWLRARTLDRGESSEDRWGLLRELSEDALVAITERPSIGADPILGRELAEAWTRAAERYGRGRMQALMRLATLRLRIRNEVQAVSTLPSAELGDILDQLFDLAAETLGTVQIAHDQLAGSGSITSSGDTAEATPASTTRRRSWAIWRAR